MTEMLKGPWYRLFNALVSSNVIEKCDFDHQVAGHTNEKLQTCFNKYIMKPRIKPELFAKEIRFYEYMARCESSFQLRNTFIPRYFGVFHEQNICKPNDFKDETAANLQYLVLEDLTLGYEKPNLIDIKMGQHTYEPTASKEKVAREIVKHPFQVQVGFRITGFKAFNLMTNEYTVVDKFFGRGLLPEVLDYGLAIFFYNGVTFHSHVMEIVIDQLEEMLKYMKVQTQFHYFCSSILIVFDAMGSAVDDRKVTDAVPAAEEVSSSSSTENQIEVESDRLPTPPSGHSSTTIDSVESLLKINEQLSAINLTDNIDSTVPPEASSSSEKNSDAHPSRGTHTDKVKVAMIDFAHTIHFPEDSADVQSEVESDSSSSSSSAAMAAAGVEGGLDVGYIYGLTQLICRLRAILSVVTCKDDNIIGEFIRNMELVLQNSRK